MAELPRYPKITRPWRPIGVSSIETHEGEMLVTVGGHQTNEWTRQMICDGVNFLARSWLSDSAGADGNG